MAIALIDRIVTIGIQGDKRRSVTGITEKDTPVVPALACRSVTAQIR